MRSLGYPRCRRNGGHDRGRPLRRSVYVAGDTRNETYRRNVTLYASPWEAALSVLEWGKVTARLSARASSEPGRALCAALSPGTDLEAIRTSLEENRDGRRVVLPARRRPPAGV